MSTCFLWIDSVDETQCYGLRLDKTGQMDAPLAWRTIDEVKQLQQDARTIVVLPASCSSLHVLALPWLAESKARTAIPYALEEGLAQPVDTLHFSFDKAHYQQQHYLIVATDKLFLMDLMTKLDTLGIRFDAITLDWFALQEDEASLTPTTLLVHDKQIKGALQGELIPYYLQQADKNLVIMKYPDSMEMNVQNSVSIAHESPRWIAERLLAKPGINLCQGALQHDKRPSTNRWWYSIAAVLSGLFVVCVMIGKLWYLHVLNQHIAEIDKKIAVIYREFFPEAAVVISPKFRVSQWLKTNNTPHASSLWPLLSQLGQAFEKETLSIKQLHFQKQTLAVTLTSKDFAALEQLQQRLKRAGLKTTQTQAVSHEHHVEAILELSL